MITFETPMTISLILLLALGTFVSVAVLSAAESKPPLATGIDPKFSDTMRPGPEHQQLAKLVGSWEVDCSMRMSPGAPVIESRGSSLFRAILDGRFLQADFSDIYQGQPFTGLSLMGFARASQRYVSTWCDSTSTGFICLQGTSTDDGRTITYVGEMVCPQLGRTTLRQVGTHEQDDRFTLVMYQTPDDQSEFKSMELVYRRRG